jgi:RES domain-containing protein
MKTFWRISGYADLSGEGARIVSARWHSKGNRVVYLAESPAGAMLERLVHLPETHDRLPRTYDLLEVSAPEQLAIKDLTPLAEIAWKDRIELTRQIGDAWLLSRETVLARVPSAVVARTWNIMLNPEHREAEHLKIESVIRERFDDRFFRFAPS